MTPFQQRKNENETKGSNEVPEPEEIIKDLRTVDVWEKDVENVGLARYHILDNEQREEGYEEGRSSSVFPPDEDCLEGVYKMKWRAETGQSGSLSLSLSGRFFQGETVEELNNITDSTRWKQNIIELSLENSLTREPSFSPKKGTRIEKNSPKKFFSLSPKKVFLTYKHCDSSEVMFHQFW